jgi:hypothetical protein
MHEQTNSLQDVCDLVFGSKVICVGNEATLYAPAT